MNYHLRPNTFYPSFIDDIAPSYCPPPTTVPGTNKLNQRSPTIPNIILTDVDSSKLDFSNSFDSLIDSGGLQLDAADFLLNSPDLSVDPIICDDRFRLEHK